MVWDAKTERLVPDPRVPRYPFAAGVEYSDGSIRSGVSYASFIRSSRDFDRTFATGGRETPPRG